MANGHLTGNVTTEDMGKGNFDPGHPLTGPDIKMIQRTGLDSEENLAGPRGGFGLVAGFQDIETAVLPEENRFHHKNWIFRIFPCKSKRKLNII